MPINADEDVESTTSIIDYGRKLCEMDLRDFLNENNSSQEFYWLILTENYHKIIS